MPDHSSQLRGGKRSRKAKPSTAPNGTDRSGNDATPEDPAARQRSYELEFISKSGLFDAEFYLSQYPDVAQAGVAALEHFFDFGYREGRRPNPYFDPL